MSETPLKIVGPIGDPGSETHTAPQAVNLVQVDHVTKSFGYKTALKDISFSIPLDKSAACLVPTEPAKPRSFVS